MGFDWKSLLGNVAPLLGTAIGGPFGALAGTAVKAALGLADDSDEEAIQKAMQKATPEQLLALQNAERQFKLDMEKLNVDVMKLDADDRNSARQREVTITGWGKYATPMLAGLATMGFMLATGYVLTQGMHGIDPGVAAFIGSLIGNLSSKAEMVYNYYFGSSLSSKGKDQMLFNSAPTK